MQPIICPDCGRPNAGDAQFCNQCAKPLYDARPAPPLQQWQKQQQWGQWQQPPHPQQAQQGKLPKKISVGSILFWVISLGAILYFITWSYERNFGQMRAAIDSFMGWKPTPPTKPVYGTPPLPPASTTGTTPNAQRTISKAQFDRPHRGMSYAEVIGVIGREGKKISDSMVGKVRAVSYRWEAGGLASVRVTFDDDKLVSKDQFGLN